jgi:broad specificity phosphatase PhoE
MTEGLAELTDEHSPRGTLLVISHGGSIRMFLGSIREPIVPPMHNGETYEVLRATGTFHTFRKLHDDRRG